MQCKPLPHEFWMSQQGTPPSVTMRASPCHQAIIWLKTIDTADGA